MLFYLILFIHITSCLWWYIVTVEGELWIPPKDIYIAKTYIYEETVAFQYFLCFYYTIMIVGSNELFPTSVL